VLVLYGVCGEGMGHAMRSAVVAEHLMGRGHDVRFVSSGSAARYLGTRWPGRVTSALGLRTVMMSNKILPMTTLLTNIAGQTIGLLAHGASFLSLGMSLEARPGVVISDFDPWTARYARTRRIPLVAVDNVHFMNRCMHPQDVVASDRTAAAIMYPTVNRMVPDARAYLVTTFAGAPVSGPSTTLHLPILRPEILRSTPTVGSHVTAYFNENSDHASIAGVLQGVGAQFRIYGMRGVSRDETHGNITYRPFSEGQFIRDLASSSSVIGGAGFTFMTEAIYLQKPMLAVPFGGQFEQILNANYLARLGYGERAHSLDRQTVSGFLARASTYRQNLERFRHDGNRELLQAVERAIA
jgi:uncharacterized protein (TIGR00661 family)